jgi:tetratricopeptide (TPR) repeat protein
MGTISPGGSSAKVASGTGRDMPCDREIFRRGGEGAMVRFLTRFLLTFFAVTLAVAASPAHADKQYCTPEAYLPSQIEASMKVCDALIADKRHLLRDYIQAYENRGDLYMRKGQVDVAMQNYDQAVALLAKVSKLTESIFDKITPTSVDKISAASVFYQRGMAFRHQGQNQRAIEDYTRALQYRDDAQAFWRRADAYQALGQIDQAIRDLDKAVALGGDNGNFLDERGVAYNKKGDFDRAIADFDKKISLQPQDAPAFNGRGVAYLAKGDVDRALQNFDKAVAIWDTTAEFRDNHGLALVRKGDIAGAIAEFDKAIDLARLSSEKKPELADYYVHRAEALGGKGDWLKALEDYQSALTLSAYHTKALAGRDAARLALTTASRQPAASDPTAPQAVAAAAGPAPAKPQAPSVAERRVALVIGISAYKNVPLLPNPARDATAVADALRRTGFQTVILQTDLPKEKLVDALRDFAQLADAADWAVVYYAGHGIEMGGSNYLIPVDARLSTDRDVGFEAVPMDQVLSAVDGAKKLRVVLLDACRDNPFANQMRRTLNTASRSIGRGLASIEPESGTLVVYAAKHGETALDGSGANSPFATALVKNIQIPGLEVRRMFDFVRDDVMDMTMRKQQPFSYGSISGRQEFYFVSAK